MNSYEKGDKFEKDISEIFKNNNVELRRTRQEPGDGGIDLFGGFKGYTIIIQCKNYPDPGSIGPKHLRELEGVLSRYNKDLAIGILVAPSKVSFAKN